MFKKISILTIQFSFLTQSNLIPEATSKVKIEAFFTASNVNESRKKYHINIKPIHFNESLNL